MNITILLQLIMIIIVIAIIKTENNLHLIILFFAFSLMAASLYFMYSAPDVALSEISIGCGIIPLIFIVAISKQKQFIVINQLEDNFLENNDENDVGSGYEILNDFCMHYDLELKIYNTNENQLHGVFREKNIDLIVYKCSSTDNYILKGKSSNILMNKLEQITKKINHITIIRVGENETTD